MSSRVAMKRLRIEQLEPRHLMATDLILDWNSQILEGIRAEQVTPPQASRQLAMVHIAMHDALALASRSSRPYTADFLADPLASPEAAISEAARKTLASLFPSRVATWNAFHATILNGIADGDGETLGVALGSKVADQILSLRANDGSSTTVNYSPTPGIGNWQPTPPANAPALLPQWADLQPFAMSSPSQFSPSGIPAISSAEYAAAFQEVKEIGSATSSTRTADQSNIAKFWANGSGTVTPPGHLNLLAKEIAESQQNTLLENARLFAMLNIAMADAAIMAWDTKYDTDFWRPVTAIRSASTDGNDATSQDSEWTPFLTTPPFQTYVSGHSSFSGAAESVLRNFFGRDDISFTLSSQDATVPDRSFTRISQAAEESGMSRIYGGIHFQFDNVDGLSAGRRIGSLVAQSMLAEEERGSVIGLEGRTMLVFGTQGSDRIEITSKGQRIYVSNHGKRLGSYLLSQIDTLSIDGGAGDDWISIAPSISLSTNVLGGEGNDQIFGGRGEDRILGGLGDDRLQGGRGRDQLFGEEGNDWLFGGPGPEIDELDGGTGTNRLRRRR